MTNICTYYTNSVDEMMTIYKDLGDSPTTMESYKRSLVNGESIIEFTPSSRTLILDSYVILR